MDAATEPRELRLSELNLRRLRAHGEREYPQECCGILLGSREAAALHVLEVIPCENVRAEHRGRRYQIAPEEIFAAQRHGRERGLEIVGFYHSHPDAPAVWSRTDLDEAYWTGCAYLILEVHPGTSGLMRAWLREPQSFQELPISPAE